MQWTLTVCYNVTSREAARLRSADLLPAPPRALSRGVLAYAGCYNVAVSMLTMLQCRCLYNL